MPSTILKNWKTVNLIVRKTDASLGLRYLLLAQFRNDIGWPFSSNTLMLIERFAKHRKGEEEKPISNTGEIKINPLTLCQTKES